MGMGVNLEDGAAEGDGGHDSIVAEINITPLTDVFLVLLIIFMVSSTAFVESEKATRSGVKVVLPKAKSAGEVSKRRTDPILTVTKTNELYVFNKKVTPETVEAELRKALQDVGSDTVIIRGDEAVFLGAAVNVMAVAKKAGAAHIAILTKAAEAAAP
jgi:biopolymer transport protein ExbD